MGEDRTVILLAGRLDGRQRNQLKSLLDMMYTPGELAEEIGINVNRVYMVYIPGGCPCERDDKRHIWINGRAFRAWFEEVYAKRKLEKGETFCLTCRKAVPLVNPERNQKGGTIYDLSFCPFCNRKLTRIVDQKKGKVVNRNNWKLTKAYLEYRASIDQLSGGSLKAEKTYIRHLLTWADSTSFQKIYSKRPSFPEYLQKVRLDGNEGQFSIIHIKKILTAARRFFSWLTQNYSDYKSLKTAWIQSLKPKKIDPKPKKKESVTLDEILRIAAAPTENIIERRAKAAMCFLFLSGIRIGAFVSLPIKAIDLENGIVYQYPSLGVRTKNKKYGKTYLFDIPELLEVVKTWDKEIKEVLSEDGYWFAPLSPDTKEIDPTCNAIGEHRESLARRNLKNWLQKVGLKYHSPHAFRHGNIQFGMQNAKTIADYKAVSMNVMHSSMDITDNVYSQLGDQDIRNRIGGLNQKGGNSSNNADDTFRLFQEFLAWREESKIKMHPCWMHLSDLPLMKKAPRPGLEPGT